jgi:spore coat polysaccharide biosynthesis protein SpsF
MSKPRIIATIEARMTSRRLPGKVLMPAGGRPMLGVLISRLRTAKSLDGVVLATTVNATDDPVAALGRELGIGVFRGSEDDVLGRVCGALQSAQAEVCVEITGDCPLIDPQIVDEAVAEYLRTSTVNRYVSNSDPHRSVPAGLDVQVFDAKALYELEAETDDPADREHVSFGFYRPESHGKWKPRFISHPSCVGGEDLLVTLDYSEDYRMMRELHEQLSARSPRYGAADIIRWIKDHPKTHAACRVVRSAELVQ